MTTAYQCDSCGTVDGFCGLHRCEAVPVQRSVEAGDRASMFIEWCALHGFGLEGWPPGAHAQLVAHLKEAANGR